WLLPKQGLKDPSVRGACWYGDVPFGSLAVLQDSTIRTAAFGGKADDLAERLIYVIAIERRQYSICEGA
ncbi:MAG: hypothetical protein O6944_03660, partial [Gammaproteobacteria bacterium]|nr:hypothetical protein [Gammaproteobacteria bacterium]